MNGVAYCAGFCVNGLVAYSCQGHNLWLYLYFWESKTRNPGSLVALCLIVEIIWLHVGMIFK